MGNSNIKQQSSNVIGDGNFGGQVVAKGATFGTIDSQSVNIAGTGTFGTIGGQSANIAGSGVFGNIIGQTSNISGTGTFGSISSDSGKFGTITGQSSNISGTGTFGSISGTSLALQKGNITWGFNITDKNDLCITQNGNNLTCISQQGVLY